MKTFEERFTAWIDDRLPADEHAAFEREIAARPDAAALFAEKRMAVRLRDLLREHFHAPALSNPDFFNRGILERITAEERDVERTSARPRRRWWAAALAGAWEWTPARLLTAGAACLLTALVGVRALIPTAGEPRPPATVVAQNAPAIPSPTVAAPPAPTAEQPANADPRGPVAAPRTTDDGVVAKNEARPPAVPDNTAFEPHVAPGSTVTATPVHFDDQNADVLWLDGLDYLPDVNGATTATPSTPTPPSAPPAANNQDATPPASR